MSELLEKHVTFLLMLNQANTGQRKALLKHASGDQFMAVITLIFNILRGNIPLADEDKILLSRHKKYIRILTSKTIGRRVKRELLITHHSILPICIRSYRSYLSTLHDEQADDSSDKGYLPETDVRTGRRTAEEEDDDSQSDSESKSSDTGTSSSDSEWIGGRQHIDKGWSRWKPTRKQQWLFVASSRSSSQKH